MSKNISDTFSDYAENTTAVEPFCEYKEKTTETFTDEIFSDAEQDPASVTKNIDHRTGDDLDAEGNLNSETIEISDMYGEQSEIFMSEPINDISHFVDKNILDIKK